MRTLPALLVAALVLLAGCNTGFVGGEPAETPTATATPAGETPTPTPTPSQTATPTPTATGFDFADPEEDRLGWEAGYWYNETVAYNGSDGLNATERERLVARSMARVEHIRQLEFRERVPIEVIDRETYQANYSGGDANYTDSFRTFDNAKFEALFLIGEDEDSLAVQNTNRGSSVLGFYSPRNDTIVVVSEDTPPRLNDELTLGHELMHALQDQAYNLTNYTRPTREVYNAYNGLFEGDSHYTEQRYRELCDSEWECLSVESESSGGGTPPDFHFGVYFANYFPYSDGPPFVRYHRNQGGWERINAMYEDPPASSEQVIYPEKYGEDQPTNVTLTDRTANGWERVRPEPPRPNGSRPAYASFGQSVLSASFGYTISDNYNRSSVIQPSEFINQGPSGVNRSDPFNYDLAYTSGWDGDRMHVYRNPDAGTNETAYVWRLVWDSPAEAREFAGGYRLLLEHWSGSRVSGNASTYTYRVDRLPFEDAFHVRTEGATVTIVNAPTVDDLDDVWTPATVGTNTTSSADGSDGGGTTASRAAP